MKSRRHSVQPNSAAEMLSDCLGLRLQNLRRLRDTTQVSLAETLRIGQTALSHLERRDDILLSTLVAYIEALGGRLQIAATFSDADPVQLFGNADWVPAASAALDAGNDQLCLPSILGPEQLLPSRDVGGVSPNRRKFRQVKFSPATIASKSITCPLSRKV